MRWIGVELRGNVDSTRRRSKTSIGSFIYERTRRTDQEGKADDDRNKTRLLVRSSTLERASAPGAYREGDTGE